MIAKVPMHPTVVRVRTTNITIKRVVVLEEEITLVPAENNKDELL